MTRGVEYLLRLLGMMLYHVGLHKWLIRRRAEYVRTVLYHDCSTHQSDYTAGLQSTTTPAHFAAHLGYYARNYSPITAAQLKTGLIPPCSVLITFDDGYRSVLTNAVPALIASNMSATIFLVTSVVGNQRFVWVNEMNWLLRSHPADAFPIFSQLTGLPRTASPRDMIFAVRMQYDPAKVERALAETCAVLGIPRLMHSLEAQLYLTWDEVRGMKELGFLFGNHTLTHPNLSCLDQSEQEREISAARQDLRAFGCESDWLAYPFGDHSHATRDAALRVGSTLMMEVGGRHGPLDLRRLGRVPVDALSSEAQLFAQIEVVEPVKAWLKWMIRDR